MAPSVAEILAAASGGENRKIAEFDGQVLTWVDFTAKSGKNGDYLVIDALNADAEEVKIATGSEAVVDALKGLKVAGLLPIELKVRSFSTQHGTKGYELVEVDS